MSDTQRSDSSRPFVSILMPALNEAGYIAPAIESITPAPGASFDYEILVVDGGSTDGTRRIVARLAESNPSLRLVSNEERLQSAGINRGAGVADPRATFLLRADCHALYPRDFVAACLTAQRESGADSVVVPMHTRGRTCMQRAIAAAQNSKLGNGGSAHRAAGDGSTFVDHGHHALFRREAFAAVGGYDPAFVCNEDAELDVRLGQAGYRIWLSTPARITYFARPTLRGLARQYWRHGAGRARTLVKHRLMPRLRQVLPAAVVAANVLALVLAVGLGNPLPLAVPFIYAALCLTAGAALAWRERSACVLASGLAAMVMHLSWGSGFIAGLVRHLRPGRPSVSGQTPAMANE